ncbi:lysophospholipase [Aeoliella sp. ICT_H6.2]|uniref:Lysophospholipase n=1 Tax=Aeoliella straminimaris TaxID=2954799 RepID=A0A9X2F793_9BACT|nr:alpha/beta fold hydrolase [Aeoliella straminimaris]MCO6043530.1 lysophospholipase [Aeoliella straminimaris]
MISRHFIAILTLTMVSPVVFAPAGMAQSSNNKVPDPLVVNMKTKDGVELVGTYYKSTAGKDATPVVMLADWKDSRAVYDQLAKRMQAGGNDDKAGFKWDSFAVLTVDLRGHGDSTKQRLGANAREIDAAKLDRNDLGAMVQFDMNAVRRFLVEKNDAGELNLNRLSIVGASLGASVAVNWSMLDWSFPPLAVGKQGQDVKGLVLISPEWSYKGLQMNKALRHPGVREHIAVLVMYGGDERKNLADAKRIEKQLERYHPEPDDLEPGVPNSLALLGPNTKLQGTKLLTQGGAGAELAIIKFLNAHVAKENFDWLKRGRD